MHGWWPGYRSHADFRLLCNNISKMAAFRGLFHLGCGIFYIYGTYHDLQVVTAHTQNYGGRFKYLTFLNLVSFERYDRWPWEVTQVCWKLNCEIGGFSRVVPSIMWNILHLWNLSRLAYCDKIEWCMEVGLSIWHF